MNNTILIVDDVRLNIDALVEILGEEYKIMAAVSGKSAIALLERKQPDLVLLDVSMPGVDGFDVLRFIKSRRELENIPVIFVTGGQDADAEERGLALGAVDYIKKPFSSAVIRVKVRNHLELKAHRDNLEALVYERTRQLEEKTRQLTISRDAVIMGLSLMSESHDSITGEHIMRIKDYTRILADRLLKTRPDMLTPELAAMTVLYSPLHDVGKVAISDAILGKTGKLTAAEFGVMMNHTLEGAWLLRKTEQYIAGGTGYEGLQIAADIAECHHEKYDGSGYPHGLKGIAIPLPARIVTIADIYDALRSTRPYKDAVSHECAVRTILEGDGRTCPEHFDPAILAAFSEVSDEFDRAYNIERK